ncbi:LPXTG cell wall anchor domain-containing protein [Streptococcus pluranimalium]|uniref:LPXTG cell wall anchor domain-containing protein n=1 Tax=Streptococcus pluranimalium TaxID=82348 RepID=UPI003F69420B
MSPDLSLKATANASVSESSETSLPKTGEASSRAQALAGLFLFSGALLVAKKRRDKKEL